MKLRSVLLAALAALSVWLYTQEVLPTLQRREVSSGASIQSLSQEMYTFRSEAVMPCGAEILKYWT